MGRSERLARYVYPLLNFNQGIPALSWVVIAIIWFRGIEFRIFFIMVMTTLPAFSFQVLDSYRAMSKDLFEMTLSFRPIALRPVPHAGVALGAAGDSTAWKVNLGNASRVVVVAELVGATGGVGYELLQQQQLFDMAGAVAWTLVLVFFVLIVQWIITAIENSVLRYRASDGAFAVTAAEIALRACEQDVSRARRRATSCGARFELFGRSRRIGRDPGQDRLRQVDHVQSRSPA